MFHSGLPQPETPICGDHVATWPAEDEDRALRAREKLYRDLVENANDLIYVIDLQGNFTAINRAAQRISGYTREEVLRMNIAQMVASDYLEGARQMIQKALRGEPPTTHDLAIVTKDGRRVLLEISHRLLLEDGIPKGTHAIARDITERHRAEQLDRDRMRVLEMIAMRHPLEAILRHLAETVEKQYPEAMCLVTLLREGRLEKAAAPRLPESFVSAVTGCRPGRSGGSCSAACDRRQPVIAHNIAADPVWEGAREAALRHGMAASWSIPILASSGKALGAIGVYWRKPCLPESAHWKLLQMCSGSAAIAIEQRQLTDQLAYQAHYDGLTGLPNRVLFQERLQQGIAGARRSGTMVALLYIDLDRFKLVNDSLGHATGDMLLTQVARRLNKSLRETDTLARISGDEFTVMATNLRDPQSAQRIAETLLDSLKEPFVIEGHERFVTASVGISVYPQDAADVETLQRNADTAMYRAKNRGKNRYQYFLPEMGVTMFERLEVETYLRRALERGEFSIHYQPQFELPSGRMVGLEALLRWNHPKLGAVSPGKFIPIAEENGLIVPIGLWVLQQACEQARDWRQAGHLLKSVSVNVSALQFGRSDFVETVDTALERSGLDPRFLELELTESLVIRDVQESAQKMAELQQLGVRISVDDFGTGYSSLSYLQRLPIDILKLDRSFVEEFKKSPSNSALVEGIVTLAHDLGMRVTAEGVETEQQLEAVHLSGCDKAQGYLLGRPLPAEAALLVGPHAYQGRQRPALRIAQRNGTTGSTQ